MWDVLSTSLIEKFGILTISLPLKGNIRINEMFDEKQYSLLNISHCKNTKLMSNLFPRGKGPWNPTPWQLSSQTTPYVVCHCYSQYKQENYLFLGLYFRDEYLIYKKFGWCTPTISLTIWNVPKSFFPLYMKIRSRLQFPIFPSSGFPI